MTDHTPNTQKVAPLPDSARITQALEMIDNLSVEARFLLKMMKEANAEIRGITERINKLRLMLEAK